MPSKINNSKINALNYKSKKNLFKTRLKNQNSENNQLASSSSTNISKVIISTKRMHSLSNFSSFTSHSKTLSHTFSTSNISSISCQRKYSCQSITEDEQQELSDEQEIKYIKYLQVLYEKHQNEEAYDLEIKNNMKELNDLRERNIEDQKKLNEQMYYSETMKELKRWEEIMDKEAELLTPICDAFDVCLPIYQKVINALEIQSNKLPVKNIVPFMTDNEESSANQTQIHELIQSTAEISAAIAELQTLLDLGPNSVPLKVLAVEQEILDMTKDIAENEKELKRLNGLESVFQALFLFDD